MVVWLAFPGKHLSHLSVSVPALFPILFNLFPQQQDGIVLEKGRNTWEKGGLESLSGAMQEYESDPTSVMSKKKNKKSSGGGMSSANTAFLVVVAD